ncbi:hypothetical protein Bca52824_070415 [Brassica carinata]|uniref:Uncharacterized protein n=1 Tax=Brassica carinata TaxID=52824 RepID=A0A8X7Q453_BRACI|nr:hypothetical protein Bca52824_070415 [Brassica carinata]
MKGKHVWATKPMSPPTSNLSPGNLTENHWTNRNQEPIQRNQRQLLEKMKLETKALIAFVTGASSFGQPKPRADPMNQNPDTNSHPTDLCFLKKSNRHQSIHL